MSIGKLMFQRNW